MRYMGGKCRQAKQICNTLISLGLNENSLYIEPFCGAMWSASYVANKCNPKEIWLSDINQYLISFWEHLLYTDDIPPSTISDDEYVRFKMGEHDNWLKAWYGFGVSFGGKWFGGLARHSRHRSDTYDFSPQVRSTIKKATILKGVNVRLACCSYEEYKNVSSAYFYLDPPYVGRTKCHCFDGMFDHSAFWDFARHISKNNKVIITAFDYPSDFRVLYSYGDTVVRHHAAKDKDGTNEVIVTRV